MQEGRTNGLSRLKGEKALGITKNAKRKEERRMDEGEERNAPGAWMRGEERKNESTKGRERRIEGWWRPRPGRYDHYHQHHHRHLYHDEHDAGQSAELGFHANAYTDTQGGLPVSFFLTLRAPPPLSLSLSTPSPSRRIHLPIFFTPRALDAILRGNVPLRWVDFLTMTLARTYCLF